MGYNYYYRKQVEEKVDRSGGPEACWPWTGRRDRGGYGRIWYEGRQAYAHRTAWEMANGPVPTKLSICHTCDNPPCCNPAHLFAGTHRENLQDAGRKGRLGKARGERHGNAKLDWGKVAVIHRLRAEGLSEREIAARFDVSQVAIHFVLTGQTWSKREEPVREEGSAA